MDYFYDNTLRWGFGFENPNKAAVIFACLIPLLFAVWNLLWDSPLAGWKKGLLSLISGPLILVAAFCLFKTFSRGAAVAVGLGLLYLFVKRNLGQGRPIRQNLGRVSTWSSLILIAGLVGLFIAIGLGNRTLEPLTNGDDSVTHRVTLWQAALQMAAENPAGFGAGHSGLAYMNWYQPLDATSAYRTMVNSYLTFLVEQGWLPFALVLLAASLFWVWSLPPKTGAIGRELILGLRASLLVFAVSGIFSTVMEEPLLWIIPGLCAAVLAIGGIRRRQFLSWPKVAWAAAVPLFLLVLLYGYGLYQSLTDPFRRTFASTQVASLSLKSAAPEAITWVLVPDAKILGADYGKLLRHLVEETGIHLRLETPAELHGPVDRLLVMGNGIDATPVPSAISTILLSPARTGQDQARAWLKSSPRLILLVPSIDEDSRARFWNDSASGTKMASLTLTTLDGIGLRADWAWEDIIRLVQSNTSTH